MSVTVAKTAGFCLGVRIGAVDLAEQQAKKNGKKFMPMVKSFTTCTKSSGGETRCVHRVCVEDIPTVPKVKLIRAHGVPRNVYTLLQAKKCEIFDATCPFVRKIKIADKEIGWTADRHSRQRRTSGGCRHSGWCGESVVLRGRGGRAFSKNGLKWKTKPISLVAQTTVNRSIWNISVGLMQKKGVQTSKFLIQYVKRRMSASRRGSACRCIGSNDRDRR